MSDPSLMVLLVNMKRVISIIFCFVRNTAETDLFVYFGPAFDLGHNHSHDAPSEGGSEGEELLVGGDVLIP